MLLVQWLSFARLGRVPITTSLSGTTLSLDSSSASSPYPSLGNGKSHFVVEIAGCSC